MAHNIRRTKAPAKLTDRLIEDGLHRMSDVKAQTGAAGDKTDAILDELQIGEYIATNRHGLGDHTFTIPPRDKPMN